MALKNSKNGNYFEKKHLARASLHHFQGIVFDQQASTEKEQVSKIKINEYIATKDSHNQGCKIKLIQEKMVKSKASDVLQFIACVSLRKSIFRCAIWWFMKSVC